MYIATMYYTIAGLAVCAITVEEVDTGTNWELDTAMVSGVTLCTQIIISHMLFNFSGRGYTVK